MNTVLRNKPFQDVVSGEKSEYECWFFSSIQRLREQNILDENFVIVLYIIDEDFKRRYIHVTFFQKIIDLNKSLSENELNKFCIFLIPVTKDNYHQIVEDIKKKHQSTLST